MTINSTTTVRDLVLERPQATRIFEKFKIDYCCGGNTPLIEACANAGVNLGEIEQLLDRTVSAREEEVVDFNQMRVPALIDHILAKHHVYTKAEMVRLTALLMKVVSVHGDNHPELRQLSALFERLCADLTPHMFKEEQILFPYIVKLEQAAVHKLNAPFAPFGTVNNPVRMMMKEHDAAGDLLREMRTTTSDYVVPADVCISYETLYEALEDFEHDLHQHIHLENNILFPRAIELEGSITG
jgi:regulator of cell morphogenesis and NO signaling